MFQEDFSNQEALVEARRAAFEAMGYHRKILLSDQPLEKEQRMTLVDLLLLLEEFFDRSTRIRNNTSNVYTD
jgi:hypothetical protein